MTAPLQPTPAETAAAPPVLGDYALGARVDRRTAADVHEATHVPTGEARLVYVLHPAAAQDHPLVHQVVCEIDAARWLRHPATAKVDGHGETPTGAPYVAVVRPAGRTLAQALAAGEVPGRRRFVRIANRLVEALDEAHAVGLSHGRLTPAAIVVGDECDEFGTPPVTITGFGVAAIAHDGPFAADELPYVAPELQAGGDPDERSDVFALASVLHHLLAGSAPAAPGAPAAATTGHAAALAVLAGARASTPAQRSRSVKALWEELMAALVDDAATGDAPAAAAAAAAPTRTSGEVAMRTLLEQLEHERRHAPPRAEGKATLLSPMPGAVRPATSPPAAPVAAPADPPVASPSFPGARRSDAWESFASMPASADASAALASLARPAPPIATTSAFEVVMPPAAPPPARPEPAAERAPAGRSSGERPAPERAPVDRAPVDRVSVERASAERAPSRAIPARPPARSRHRPRAGFLLAMSVAAPLAFLAVVRWPAPSVAAPVVDPEPPAIVAIRAAMAVEAAKQRRARAVMSGRRPVEQADEPVDSLAAEALPEVQPIHIPAVAGVVVPTLRASVSAPVRPDEFRRLRVAVPDSLP